MIKVSCYSSIGSNFLEEKVFIDKKWQFFVFAKSLKKINTIFSLLFFEVSSVFLVPNKQKCMSCYWRVLSSSNRIRFNIRLNFWVCTPRAFCTIIGNFIDDKAICRKFPCSITDFKNFSNETFWVYIYCT